jgi:hypothetical protein
MVDRFGIGCSIRPIMTTTFCDLKLIDAINQWGSYDLSSATTQLPMVYDYIFVSHPNTDIQKLRCQAMIQQYRYSANPLIKKLTQWCSSTITTEAEYISNMVAVNEEVRSNKFNNKIYSEPSINRYKLMSWYQYFIPKITTDQFNDEDVTILTNYDSYITKLVSRWSIAQPYWDIISVFHQQYLIPWLDRRDSFAKPNEKALTQALKKTTDLIIYGDTSQGMVSITSWSRIKPIDFLMSQWLYYGDNDATTSWSSSINNQISTSEPQSSSPATTTQVTWSVTTQQQDTTTSGDSSLDALISQVLGTTPTATPIKRWQIILIKYNYKWVWWIAAVDLWKKWATQLYYDSLISGATKITHPKVIFNTSNKELIIAIMNNHISTNPQ